MMWFANIAEVFVRLPVKAVLKAALSSWVAPGFVIPDGFERQFVLGLLYWDWKTNARGYSGVMPAVFRAEELGKLYLLILMLVGDRDRLNPPKALTKARQMIPDIETGIIPNAGHLLSMVHAK
jgi:pimeloyl-ACP methyl ester carboxylesterase